MQLGSRLSGPSVAARAGRQRVLAWGRGVGNDGGGGRTGHDLGRRPALLLRPRDRQHVVRLCSTPFSSPSRRPSATIDARARARRGGLTKLCPNLRFADGGSGLGAVVLSICNFAGCVVRGRTSGVSIAGGATEPQHRIDVRRCPPARGPRRSSSSARSGCDSRRPRTAP